MSLVDQTKRVTAASELARNTLIHGGGGYASVEQVPTELLELPESRASLLGKPDRQRLLARIAEKQGKTASDLKGVFQQAHDALVV